MSRNLIPLNPVWFRAGFLWIPLSDYYDPQCNWAVYGSIIPYNDQPTRVLNTAHMDPMDKFMKIPDL